MAIVYFDSSALVKLVVEEDGSALVASLWDNCDSAVSSRIAYSEVRAALAAARRDHRIDAKSLETAKDVWKEYWAAAQVVEFNSLVAHDAGELAESHSLRAADAVHLASALQIGSPDLILAAWDARLREGAHAAGIALAPR